MDRGLRPERKSPSPVTKLLSPVEKPPSPVEKPLSHGEKLPSTGERGLMEGRCFHPHQKDSNLERQVHLEEEASDSGREASN